MEEVEKLKKELVNMTTSRDIARMLNKSMRSFLDVKQVFHSKKRNNTTVLFKDGHSITVKKAKGDKDCLHTALAFALAKNLYNLNQLARDTEEK